MKTQSPLLSIIGALAGGVALSSALALGACAAPPEGAPKMAGHNMGAMPMPAAAPAPPAPPAPPAATKAAQPAPDGKTFKVRIDNFVFAEQTITVPVGATVTWVNGDDIPHTVVSSDHKTFRSKTLDTDQSFSFTFTAAGEYPYFCSIHPHMTGKVVVTPG